MTGISRLASVLRALRERLSPVLPSGFYTTTASPEREGILWRNASVRPKFVRFHDAKLRVSSAYATYRGAIRWEWHCYSPLPNPTIIEYT